MATDGKKLNQLPELTTLSDATMLYAVDGGEDYHVNFETIKDETVPEVFTPTTDGLVPHPNSGNGGKVLRGDGTWQGTFDSSNDGLVPKLGTNDKDKVLRGDGTWVANDKLIGTGSGSLVTFEAIEAPMPTLKVSVEAKQDLHGYDKPWVGGAGKNKLPLTVDGIKALNTSGTWSGNTYTQDGVTFIIQTDVDGNVVGIKANGNATANIVFMCGNYILKAGSSIKYSGSVNGSANTFWVAYHGYPKAPGGDGTADRTSASTDWDGNLEIGITNGTSLSNQMFYPMIRLASEADATFAPYTNICPISGCDEANVSDVGKNLLIPYIYETMISGVTLSYKADGSIKASGTASSAINRPLQSWATENDVYTRLQAGTYTPSLTGNISGISLTVLTSDGTSISSGTPFTLTEATDVFMRLSIASGTVIPSGTVINMMIERGERATTFEPYNGQTTTISLGQTAYGGELDVVNGELKITDGYIASYNGETLPSTWISSMDEYAEGTSPTTGAEVCYELASPIITNLTPTLIKSLNGQNNLSVDCGEVIEGEYQRSITEAINALEAGGGGSITEVIMGGLDRVYGTTAANYIGTFNQWDSIDTGKSFADYDEIMLIVKEQNNANYGGKTAYKIQIDKVDTTLLQHYDIISRQFLIGSTQYVKYGLDYTNNKFYLENFNYACPIALVGVKY